MNANWVLAIVIILWGSSILIQDIRHRAYKRHVEDELDGLDDTIVAYQDRVQDLTHALRLANETLDNDAEFIRFMTMPQHIAEHLYIESSARPCSEHSPSNLSEPYRIQ